MYWGYQLVVVVVVDRMVLFVQEGFEVLQAVLALAECAMVVCEETSVDLIRSPPLKLFATFGELFSFSFAGGICNDGRVGGLTFFFLWIPL